MTETRACLARRVGATPDRIALVDSVSTACAIVILGMKWRAGDHALICDSEPPGAWAALREAARRGNFAVSSFPALSAENESTWLERFASELRPATRLIVASHVDWISGSRLPLSQMIRVVRGGPCPEARILIDGAQAVGTTFLDLGATEIDFYCFGGQKWLCGPDGIAALYIREAAQLDVEPTVIGWRALEPTADGLDLQLATHARRYESGTGAYSLCAALRCAIELADAFAPLTARAARIAQLSQDLRARLRSVTGLCLLGSEPSSGIVSFQIEGRSAPGVLRHLEASSIIARQHYFPPCVRVCVHYFTLQAEIDRLCGALARL
jgi:L-cysteine/cystine lyase